MKILGIETSCDDTCAALVEKTNEGLIVHSHIIASQAQLHTKYGGVVPELAARQHVEAIIPTIQEALGDTKPEDINAIAVTTGPGLITSLHVGVETAKSLAYTWNKPLIPTNHIAGHIYSGLLAPVGELSSKTITYPALALIVSGGHTELILMTKPHTYTLIGRTRDDAAGEAFDKAAKMLGLPYPGGPEISKRAQHGDPHAYELPRPMIHEKGYEFSFSGLKNAIRLLIEKEAKNSRHFERRVLPKSRNLFHDKAKGISPLVSTLGRDDETVLSDEIINNICASIQEAIIEVLVTKTIQACEAYTPQTIILAGGVAANEALRNKLATALPQESTLYIPERAYCMDNAAMIAAVACDMNASAYAENPKQTTAQSTWELV